MRIIQYLKANILNFKILQRRNIFYSVFFILHSLFFILNSLPCSAQDVKVAAKFSADSVEIGKPIEYYLSAHHPVHTQILFPDSSFSFTPFEFQKKKFFTTKTKNGVSVDSAIYFLTTFEIDSIQRLKLPVFIVSGRDSTQVFSNADTVYLKHLVKSIPDSVPANQLPLKANTNYLNVPGNFNYFLMVIVGGILIAVLILIWIFFGKRIRKYFRIRRLTSGYHAFLQQYENAVDNLQREFSAVHAEGSLVIWKKYLESLLNKPYTKFTSKEIRVIEQNEKLGDSLSAIDRMIYGGMHENFRTPFDSLKDYVQEQYEKRKAEIANG